MGELLESVKNYLDITWADERLDEKLTGIIRRGQAYLNQVAGEKLNYETEGTARALLFDYVRYVRAECGQDFAGDYALELNTLAALCEVKHHDEANPEISDVS